MSERTGRRLRLAVAYDGTDFHGWQRQPGRRTVQGLLEDALSRIDGERPVTVRGAGRTDAGVHAEGQVADAWVGRTVVDASDAAIFRGLRGLLPSDLAVREVRTVHADFHAQRDAEGKTYRYAIDTSAHGDPRSARYAWHLYGALDVDAMRRAGAALAGRHDWTGYTAAHCTIEHRVRTLEPVGWHVTPGRIEATFRGDGFLTFMLRNIVGTLVEIGRGRLPERRAAEALERRDRSLAGPTAPARGLTLLEVRYPSPS